MRTVPAITTPADDGPRTASDLRANFETLRSFSNDHDASHWPFVLSAPDTADVTAAAGTGGALTSSSTVRFVLAWKTPNGTTKASQEIAVALDGAQNAIDLVLPIADLGFTPIVYAYMAPTGAAQGATRYRMRPADLQSAATIDADGGIHLSSAATTAVKLVVYPPTNDAVNCPEPPAVNTSAAQDPANLSMIQSTVTQTASVDGDVITMTEGDSSWIWTYAGEVLASLTVKRKGVTVARYAVTIDSSGEFANMTQLEA